MTDAASRKVPIWKDWPLLVAERLARQVYWNSPRLRSWVKKRRSRSIPTPQVADRQQLKQFLRELGGAEGALVMAHTGVSGLRLTEGPGGEEPRSTPVLVAKQLLDDLLELLGDTGTLVMPPHAHYQGEDESGLHADPTRPVTYDPARTPSAVGLANEPFRRGYWDTRFGRTVCRK